jgi:peptide/nickel transport system ATP-binding protein
VEWSRVTGVLTGEASIMEDPMIEGRARGDTLIELDALEVEYVLPKRRVRAVDRVSLKIRSGEIVGLAGESGCGKTTTANAILQILRPPAEISGGRVLFRGEDITRKRKEELRRFRWRNVSMVFQSAMSALNPVMRVGDQFVDMIKAHEPIRKRDALARAGDLLERVGIDRRRIHAYPHELSGGMRQRVIIAMALALEPELVIMDEPTTALDVVVQREILQEIQDLQRELEFAVLFITHDLSLLLEFADRIAIMYAGEIVETTSAARLFENPLHPYTVGLVRSFPPLTGPIERMTGIPGTPPDLANPPSGCRFHPRCPHCRPEDPVLAARQTGEVPLLREVEPDHLVACHLYGAESGVGSTEPPKSDVPALPAPERT